VPGSGLWVVKIAGKDTASEWRPFTAVGWPGYRPGHKSRETVPLSLKKWELGTRGEEFSSSEKEHCSVPFTQAGQRQKSQTVPHTFAVVMEDRGGVFFGQRDMTRIE